MATATTAAPRKIERGNTVSIRRLIVTGALTAAVVFGLCWVGTSFTFSGPTHAYISLFTREEMSSVQALAEGGLWSLLFGALVGGVFALIYNATASFDRQ